MNTIATPTRPFRVVPPTKPHAVDTAPATAPEFGPREIQRHVEAVVTENDFRPEAMVKSHRAKLAAALRYLGERWIGHPARRLGKQAHQHRDGIVAGLSFALATPVLVAHYVGWLA